jgi:hypothetical protein
MNSLLDFFAFTKGVEYLSAIAFFLVLAVFWLMVYGSKKSLVPRIVSLLYVLVGFVLMIGSCFATRPH